MRPGPPPHARMPRAIVLLLLGLLGVGPVGTGCGRPKGRVLGKAPQGPVRTILAVQAGDTPLHVTIQGRLVEKCPTAGCWFRLADETSVMKVDTKAAGFVVTELPLETPVTVSGKVIWQGEQATIEASGLRY